MEMIRYFELGFVFSPVWDTLCLPYDLTMPVVRMRIVNASGEPIKRARLGYSRVTDENGRIEFLKRHGCGDVIQVEVSADGYGLGEFSVETDGVERTYVMPSKEEYQAKLEARRRAELERLDRERQVAEAKGKEEAWERELERRRRFLAKRKKEMVEAFSGSNDYGAILSGGNAVRNSLCLSYDCGHREGKVGVIMAVYTFANNEEAEFAWQEASRTGLEGAVPIFSIGIGCISDIDFAVEFLNAMNKQVREEVCVCYVKRGLNYIEEMLMCKVKDCGPEEFAEMMLNYMRSYYEDQLRINLIRDGFLCNGLQ